MRIPGFTSTSSKRPDALYGAGAPPGLPVRLARSDGALVWDVEGRQYVDFIMALGAVALGYRHPAVSAAAHAAIEAGGVGALSPESEEHLAARLAEAIPALERCRFLKTGAEACAAAVRIARAHTGRDFVLRCGYHGWLDWSQPAGAPGVPAATNALSAELPFNDGDRGRDLIRQAGDGLAAVLVEPVIEGAPDPSWLRLLREETERVGAVLVFDELKTAFRIALGGATERYRVTPDLLVLGKAMANGYPLAAVGGSRAVMESARRTWISSTLATEGVSLAAALATLEVMQVERVPARLAEVGQRWWDGLAGFAARYPEVVVDLAGLPEMCFLRFRSDTLSALVARAAAERGLLFKRTAYNFVSLAHTPATIDTALALLEESCRAVPTDGHQATPHAD